MPQLQIFQCPACGANLSYDGGPETTLTCQFCGATVVVPEEVRGKPASVPPPLPQETVYTPPRPTRAGPAGTAQRAGRPAGWSGLGCVALFILALVGFAVAMNYLPTYLSGSYRQAVDAIRTDPAAIAALGAPIEVSWWLPVDGQIKCQGSAGCSAGYNIYIHGPRGSGHIYVGSSSHGGTLFSEGTWQLRYDLHVDSGPVAKLISSTPTLTAQQAAATHAAMAAATEQAQMTQAAQATATQATRLASTATAEAQATEYAAATAEAKAIFEDVLDAGANWPVVLSDNFADNHLRWPVKPVSKQGLTITSTVAHQSYLLQVIPGHGVYVQAFPDEPSPFTDFTARVTVAFDKGGENGLAYFGLVFREAGDQYGFFGVNRNGQYYIMHGTASMYDFIDGSSAAILAGLDRSNELSVLSSGTDLVFLVNNQLVGVMDNDLPPGEVGLGAQWEKTSSEPVSVQFHDFEVRAPK